MSIRDQMDQVYSDMSPDNIPWNLTEPPSLLVDLVAECSLQTE